MVYLILANTVNDDRLRPSSGPALVVPVTATYPSSYRHSRVSPPLFSYLLGASFYRLYHEFFILDWNVQLGNELEYFCCVQGYTRYPT
jgi:hypothetical protein